jgi:hypothetical protein
MMDRIRNKWKVFLGLLLAVLLTESCSQQARDQAIKADLTVKAKEDMNFAGVQFYVKDGLVRLIGVCPTPKSREMIKQKLSTIHVIDSVEDRLTIAPVSLGPNLTLKQQVDSVLAKYPTVMSSVSETSITLVGDIESSELQKLLPVMKKLRSNVNATRLNTNDLSL